MEYAPILVSVYNRYTHLQKCIDSLKRNKLAQKSELYIVSDAAGREEDSQAIEQVRSYIKGINGFKKVHLIANESNYGSVKSITDARNLLFEKYDSQIFMEDDIEVSPYFLEYMNTCLDKYASHENVFAVSGYHSGFKIPMEYHFDLYFMACFPSWGIGIWKDKHDLYDHKFTSRPKDFIKENQHFLSSFKKHSYGAYRILMRDINGEIVAGDVRKAFYQFCKGMVTAIPVQSLTKSNGHDGSGENCPYDYLLQNQAIDTVAREYRLPDEVFVDPDILRRRKLYFSNFSKKIKTIRRIYYNTIYK